jgi:integrase
MSVIERTPEVVHADVVQGPPPPELARIANAEHWLALRAGASMVEHAIKAGEALNAAKPQLPRGEWLRWLEANFEGSRQTADNYRKLAANCQRVSNLDEPSLRRALDAISEDRDSAGEGVGRRPRKRRPQDLLTEDEALAVLRARGEQTSLSDPVADALSGGPVHIRRATCLAQMHGIRDPEAVANALDDTKRAIAEFEAWDVRPLGSGES